MSVREHLKRLPPEHYRGSAMVHWSLTIRGRKTGWLTAPFYYRFRELLAHSTFRYGFACPMFCLMPDHFHMLWMGLFDGSDQLLAMKHFRKSVNESLKRTEFELQDQAFDHVLTESEHSETAFRKVADYIARNPERSGLVAVDEYATYPFTGCLVPGYPQLRPFDVGYWDEFDRTVSYSRKEGLMRFEMGSGSC
jgi:REP element-mobilizing transposase RayT